MTAQQGRHVVMALLLERGADVNRAAIGNHTPLHAAAENGKLDAIHVLLDYGAQVDARTAKGKTARRPRRSEGQHRRGGAATRAGGQRLSDTQPGDFAPPEPGARKGRGTIRRSPKVVPKFQKWS